MDILLEYIFKSALIVSILLEVIKFYKLYHGKQIRLQRRVSPVNDKYIYLFAFLFGVIVPAGAIIYSTDTIHTGDWPWKLLAVAVIISSMFPWLIRKKSKNQNQ